jgi:hypothetical protein cdiviTM7_00602
MVNKIKNIIIVGLVLTSFFAAFQSVFSLNYTFAKEVVQDSNGNYVDPSDLKSKSDSNSNSDSKKNKDTPSADAKTAILPSDWKIEDILNMVLVVVTTGVGIAAVGSIVFAGVLYITARDNAAQVSKAKTMIMNTIIGIIAYILMWAFLEWIIPGGIL